MHTRRIHMILNSKCKHRFLGVFAKDRLPAKLPAKRPLILVCNTDPHYKCGEHWIVIFIGRADTAEYFDSYGEEPLPIFRRYLDKFSSRWIHNEKRLQSVMSRLCGHYCIFYSLFKCLDYSMKDITNSFVENDTTLNDYMVHRFVCDAI